MNESIISICLLKITKQIVKSFVIYPKLLTVFDIGFYTTLTNFSTKYLVTCKVYTDEGGITITYYIDKKSMV